MESEHVAARAVRSCLLVISSLPFLRIVSSQSCPFCVPRFFAATWISSGRVPGLRQVLHCCLACFLRMVVEFRERSQWTHGPYWLSF